MLTEEVGLDFDGKGPFVGERRITTKNLAKCQGYEDRTTPEADEGWPESSDWAGGGGGRADWLTRINRPRPALTEPSRKKDEPYCPFNLPGDKGQTLVNFRGGSYGFCRYGGHKGGRLAGHGRRSVTSDYPLRSVTSLPGLSPLSGLKSHPPKR